jgi:hypothetical protein
MIYEIPNELRLRIRDALEQLEAARPGGVQRAMAAFEQHGMRGSWQACYLARAYGKINALLATKMEYEQSWGEPLGFDEILCISREAMETIQKAYDGRLGCFGYGELYDATVLFLAEHGTAKEAEVVPMLYAEFPTRGNGQ